MSNLRHINHDKKVDIIRAMAASGLTVSQASKKTGIPETTIRLNCRKYNIKFSTFKSTAPVVEDSGEFQISIRLDPVAYSNIEKSAYEARIPVSTFIKRFLAENFITHP